MAVSFEVKERSLAIYGSSLIFLFSSFCSIDYAFSLIILRSIVMESSKSKSFSLFLSLAFSFCLSLSCSLFFLIGSTCLLGIYTHTHSYTQTHTYEDILIHNFHGKQRENIVVRMLEK